jgi:pilus assembly protein CpaB
MRGIFGPNDVALIAGRTLTQDIGSSNVILDGHLRRETDVRGAEAAFTALLRPGQRAIAIPLDSEGMVSNFVRPGDRVDILVNMDIPEVVEDEIQIPNAMPQVIRREVSRPTTVFLFQNVKVLAVGDEFLQPNVVAEETTRGRGARTVTIAVTPEEAQTLSFAMRYGNRTAMASDGVTFTLLLRRGDDLDTLDQIRLVTFEDFKQLGELGRLQLERNVRNSQERSSGLDAILGQQQTNP